MAVLLFFVVVLALMLVIGIILMIVSTSDKIDPVESKKIKNVGQILSAIGGGILMMFAGMGLLLSDRSHRINQ